MTWGIRPEERVTTTIKERMMDREVQNRLFREPPETVGKFQMFCWDSSGTLHFDIARKTEESSRAVAEVLQKSRALLVQPLE